MNKYTYAQIAIELSSRFKDDNLSISRGEYIQFILDKSDHFIEQFNIDEDSEDIEELIEEYISDNK